MRISHYFFFFIVIEFDDITVCSTRNWCIFCVYLSD
jgi:hypothetical protein